MTFPTLTRAGQADATRVVGTLPNSGPALGARAYLLKCRGSDLVSCTSCARRIAPAAEVGQRWVEPPLIGACSYYANLDEVGWVYGPGSPPTDTPATSAQDSQQR